MKLRRFTESGVDQFRIYLSKARENSNTIVPVELLEDDACTEIIEPEIDVEPRDFTTRGDAARYFHGLFGQIPDQQLNTDSGLWSWLSLMYFDQVCPVVNGRRTVRNDYTYIFEPNNSRHFYRHLLFVAWRVLAIAPENNRLMLEMNLSRLDKVTTEIMKRLYLIRIPAIFEVLDRIYWDNVEKRPKKGIVGSRINAGDLTHRLPSRLRQLEKTYDLQSLSADQLIELLGDEFQFEKSVKKKGTVRTGIKTNKTRSISGRKQVSWRAY